MTIPGLRSSRGVGDELCQHDGVVTVMMFYRRRASPKYRYDVIEVDYGAGGHCTWLRDPRDQLLCLEVPPAPVYKGARGRRQPARVRRAKGDSYSH